MTARQDVGTPLVLATAMLLGGLTLLRSSRRISLRSACVLVTGGSRGLGLLLARELARRGARLVLCARDEGELMAARRELEVAGAEVLALPCDVSDQAAVERLVDAAEERFGRVDVLVNVAGILQVAPAVTLSLEDLKEAMAVDFWGTVHSTLAVLPRMRARGAGRIVNITSIGGFVAMPHLLGYSSAKFAAVGFSTGLAAEVAKDGVIVTTVVPGLMRTGSFLHALVKGRRGEEATIFSVAASLPFLTIGARRAARRIVLACERGERLVVLGAPAKLLRLSYALAPNLVGAIFEVAARLLPGPGADRPESRPEPAWVYRSGVGRSLVTSLGDRAAAENNEQPVYRH